MPGRLPDFLGIGTQKGGTTSLHRWLGEHPDIYLPKCKEIHYFDLNYYKRNSWYTKHYEGAEKKDKCGEITPFYLFHPEAPGRIYETVPKAKLIVLLRDPVERTLSQIFHARKRGFETLETREALDAEASRMESGNQFSLQKHSYLSRSKYLEQMDRYETLFPKKQILVLKSEELFEAPETKWIEILNFLDLDIFQLKILPKANAGDGLSMNVPQSIRSELREELASTALGVKSRYGFGWDWAK